MGGISVNNWIEVSINNCNHENNGVDCNKILSNIIITINQKKKMKWQILSQNFHKHFNKEQTELWKFCAHQ